MIPKIRWITTGALLVTSFVLAGCGGSNPPVIEPPPAASQSGALSFASGVGNVRVKARFVPGETIDFDTQGGLDLGTADEGQGNGSIEAAQALTLPIKLAGSLSDSEEGGFDPEDWFVFEAVGGEVVDLVMSGSGRGFSTGDLDLSLYRAIGDGDFEFVDASFSEEPFERLVIEEQGRYALLVSSFTGSASYHLTVGTGDSDANGKRVSATLSSLLTVCERAEPGSGERSPQCSQAMTGQWLMTPTTEFWDANSGGGQSGLVAAQEALIEQVGLELTAGEGSPLMLTELSEVSAAQMALIASRNAFSMDPWKGSGNGSIKWGAEDRDGDGVPDMQAMYFTQALAKAVGRAKPDGISQVSINHLNFLSAAPVDNQALTDIQFASHYGLIRLREAWESGIIGAQGSEDVIVAVLDSGHVPLTGNNAGPDWAEDDQDASDSEGKLRYGFDFVSIQDIDGDLTPGIDNDPTDIGPEEATGFHGTHVAGTVAAPTGNGVGVQGVGRATSIMPVRVLGNCGCGSSFDIAQGVLYAAGLPNASGVIPGRKADVINLSLGGEGRDSAIQDVYDRAREAGVIVVAAAGNEATALPSYPAAYSNVVSVSAAAHGSTGAPQDVVLAQYSNFGPTIDVAAPGGQSFRDNNGDGVPDGVLSTLANGYGQYNGTSMAAPHVAGVAALMKSVYRDLSPQQFDEALAQRRIVVDVGSPGRDDLFGAGLIDALKAVQVAAELGGANEAPEQPPSPVPFASAVPSALVVGAMASGSAFEIVNSGDPDGEISVLSIEADSEEFLVNEVDVDSRGLGLYSVIVDRAIANQGGNTSSIRVETTENSFSIPVTYEAEAADAGQEQREPIYVALLDGETAIPVACDVVFPQDSAYEVDFPGVENGDYLLLAGTDLDGDGLFCDAFEACAASPRLGRVSAIEGAELAIKLQIAPVEQLQGLVLSTCP